MGVPTDFIQAGEISIPWLDPRKYVQWLADTEMLGLLFNEELQLLEFWRRWGKQNPSHPIFRTSLPLNKVIPFLSHGDEGRTKQKRAILIWAMKGVSGLGSRQFEAMAIEKRRLRLGGPNLNNAMKSRFVHVAVPARLYNNDDSVFDAIAGEIGKAYRDLASRGFTWRGQQWFACCVGLTGDVPFLTKAGSLQRHFS